MILRYPAPSVPPRLRCSAYPESSAVFPGIIPLPSRCLTMGPVCGPLDGPFYGFAPSSL